MIAWLRKWLWALEDEAFSWFQLRCRHEPEWVRADILEAQHPPAQVQWCLRCGAYRHVARPRFSSRGPSLWRTPRADWARDLPVV